MPVYYSLYDTQYTYSKKKIHIKSTAYNYLLKNKKTQQISCENMNPPVFQFSVFILFAYIYFTYMCRWLYTFNTHINAIDR